MAYIKLWNSFGEAIEHKKSNRKLIDESAEPVSVARVRLREWRDVHAQLRDHRSRSRAGASIRSARHLTSRFIARCWLACWAILASSPEPSAASRLILGARGIQVPHLARLGAAEKAGRNGSSRPNWSKRHALYARCVAKIEPEWIETRRCHLLKKTHSDPHWEKKRAEVDGVRARHALRPGHVCQRRVAFGPIDPDAAREIFIREALVAGELETRAPFLAHNHQVIEQIRKLEHKTRRLDVLVDDELIAAFYDQLVPADVYGGTDFDRWRDEAERSQPRLLFLSRDEVMRHEAAGITTELFQRNLCCGAWRCGAPSAARLSLRAGQRTRRRHAVVPLIALNQIDADNAIGWCLAC